MFSVKGRFYNHGVQQSACPCDVFLVNLLPNGKSVLLVPDGSMHVGCLLLEARTCGLTEL